MILALFYFFDTFPVGWVAGESSYKTKLRFNLSLVEIGKLELSLAMVKEQLTAWYFARKNSVHVKKPQNFGNLSPSKII